MMQLGRAPVLLLSQPMQRRRPAIGHWPTRDPVRRLGVRGWSSLHRLRITTCRFSRDRSQAFHRGGALEWVDLRPSTLTDVLDCHVDVAFAPAGWRRPDGVDADLTPPLKIACFARRGHPAFDDWNADAWSRNPHVLVGVAARVSNPIADAASAAGLDRIVGARVPHFMAVGPLLATTDLIATLPQIAFLDAHRLFALDMRSPPFAIDPMPHALFWSSRLRADPASIWLRALVAKALREVITASEAMRSV